MEEQRKTATPCKPAWRAGRWSTSSCIAELWREGISECQGNMINVEREKRKSYCFLSNSGKLMGFRSSMAWLYPVREPLWLKIPDRKPQPLLKGLITSPVSRLADGEPALLGIVLWPGDWPVQLECYMSLSRPESPFSWAEGVSFSMCRHCYSKICKQAQQGGHMHAKLETALVWVCSAHISQRVCVVEALSPVSQFLGNCGTHHLGV